VRAVAVSVVIAYHCGLAIPGDMGVSAFFVLSGFLITWLLLREMESRGEISLRTFYARRSLRIFPAYYLFVIVSLAIDTVRHHPWPVDRGVAAFAYLMNYYNAVHGHPTTSVENAWSLAVEEQFYLVWPVVFIALSRLGGRRALRAGLVIAIAAVVAWRSYLVWGRGVGSAYVYNAFDTRFDNLAVGCLLAVTIERWGEAASRTVARWPWLAIGTVACLAASRLMLSSRFHYGIGLTVYAVLFAVLLVQLMAAHASPLWAWLDAPAVRYVGTISYPMYLWHGWASVPVLRLHAPAPVYFALTWMTTVGLASASYYGVERRFLRRRPAAPVETVPAGERAA
jgi:peptidoglycan/LPS O-acetylase OafA/YrhL